MQRRHVLRRDAADVAACRPYLFVCRHISTRRRWQQPCGLHRGGAPRHAVHHQHLHRQPGRLRRHHVPARRAVHAHLRPAAILAVRHDINYV